MKLGKYSLIKPLVLLAIVGLAVGCETSQEFFEKTELETPSIGKDDGITPIDDSSDGGLVPPVKDPICVKDPEACDLTPVVDKPGVVTMLLAFGDLVNDKVVITEGSARLLAQNAVKYASPVEQPKILVVKDYNHNGESSFDTQYIAKTLLANYSKVDVLIETAAGIKLSDLIGYDVVWFNNPGHPMGSRTSFITLVEFKGGVILSGDDLTRGSSFDLSPLTGLRFIDNGASVRCGEKNYIYDNNSASGHRYQVEISEEFLPGIPDEFKVFEYGNDIDRSAVINGRNKIEVLAHASDKCNGIRPVIVRYEKDSSIWP